MRTAKIPHDHRFPAIFHVCRLPFAVFNLKRPALAFVNNVSISLKFLIRSATIISPVLKPSDVLFIFLCKLTSLLSVFKQKGRKRCEEMR